MFLIQDTDAKLKSSDADGGKNVESIDTILDDGDDDEDFSDEDLDELDSYLKKDYTELLQEFRDGIDGMTDDPAEAARLTALAEELETSFENVEVIEDVLDDVS